MSMSIELHLANRPGKQSEKNKSKQNRKTTTYIFIASVLAMLDYSFIKYLYSHDSVLSLQFVIRSSIELICLNLRYSLFLFCVWISIWFVFFKSISIFTFRWMKWLKCTYVFCCILCDTSHIFNLKISSA